VLDSGGHPQRALRRHHPDAVVGRYTHGACGGVDQLRPGMMMRLRLVGYDHDEMKLAVTEVAEDVVGPRDVRGLLGPEFTDTTQIAGPVVILGASLSSRYFRTGANQLELHDGMRGMVEVKLRAKSVAEVLIPSLSDLSKRKAEGSR